ncbi:MAG: hypothetical protein JSR96_09795 [Proteobacteria bacterium]|nr:hypothetical protein [Pseudomonadota bacterium]
MTFDWSTLVGLLGSALFLGGFAYANAAQQLNKVLFNLINLIGSILLLISLAVHFNLPAFVLEVCWGVIALGGLIRSLAARRRGEAQ